MVVIRIALRGKYTNDLLKYIRNNNFDMTEVLEKTNKIIQKIDANTHMSLVKYIGGHCHINSKLSKNEKINKDDEEQIRNINYIVDAVEPMEKDLVLFHGFERNTKYNEHTFEIDKVFSIKGFLSKTLSFDVANGFAKEYDFFHRKFIVVKYKKGSKQISQNIRLPTHNEYEHITFSNELLIIKDIVRYIKFPIVYSFYLCVLY